MKKMMMFAVVCAVALGLCAPGALANTILNVTSSPYLGLIDDGIPSSPVLEASYINNLIGLGVGVTQTIGTETYTRSSYTPCPGGDCPAADANSTVKVNYNDKDALAPDYLVPIHLGIDVTGWTYLLAKYDGPNYGSEVWYVGGITGLVNIPNSLGTGNWNISHYSLYNRTSVPDGGFTLMLLGGALMGLEGLRRRFRA